ncbi:mucin-17 [Hyalella azteca]|uniref:Mucin-17 n=1 Tax=Hyalella azteca TaxID=294128 RepID=A0A8B7PIG0_HYAAZ|nr:mucin-17 [Hyalella azteca]
MQSASGYSDSMLDKLPLWQKELILRKRANALGLTAAASSNTSRQVAAPNTSEAQPLTIGRHDAAAPQQLVETRSGPYYCSVKGPNRQLTVRAVSGHGILHYSASSAVSLQRDTVSGGARRASARSKPNESVDECMSRNSYVKRGDKMHHKVFHDGNYGDCGDENGALSNGEEDLQYGPGIVSKLKNRYMSLAMRENKSRPALRRFSSLEDLLDAEDGDPGMAAAPRGRTSNLSAKREAMKRARSVDCLSAARREIPSERSPAVTIAKSKSAGDALSSYSREDVIIIESSHPNKPERKPETTENVEDLKLPIKLQTIKSVFEPNGQSKLHRTKPVATTKAPTPTGYKPLPKAKPAGLTARRPDSIHEAKGSLKQVTPILKTQVRTASVGSPDTNGVANDSDLLKFGKDPFTSSVPSKPSSAQDSMSPKSSVRPPSIGSLRSEKSIENTRVLLENRKNAQKSRREEILKPEPTDYLTPKPVVLVESTPPKPNSVPQLGSPPALPQRTSIGLPIAVPPSPLPRQIPVSPISSSLLTSSTASLAANPSMLSPTSSKLLPSLTSFPTQSSTPNSAAPAPPARFMNGVSSPILDPLSTPTHSSAVSWSASAILKHKAPVSPTGDIAPTASNPPLKQPFVKSVPGLETKPTAGPEAPKTSCLLETAADAVIPSQDPNQSVVRSPSPPLNPKHFVSLKASAPKVSPASVVSPSKHMSETAAKPSHFDPSPARVTKVTTFSSTSDEVTEVVEAVNTVNRPKTSKDRWHQEQSNSLVFNFIGKKDNTPDYIENDGVDISKRVNKNLLDSGYVRLPGYDDCDSSTDDWDDELQHCPSPLRAGETPPPCPFEFLGAAVIIKGRSNLQRQPRNKKLCISFDDSATKTFEYPSEASLLEDPVGPQPSDAAVPSTLGVGLASYTPSKLILANTFELGVSRTLGSSPLPPTSKRLPPEGGEEDAVVTDKVAPVTEDYLRPAGEEETVNWSASDTSDLLF